MVKVFPFSGSTCNVHVQIILIQNDIEVWVGEDNPSEVGHTQQSYDKEHRLVRTYLRFLFLWQALFRVSDVGISMLLSLITMFISIFGKAFGLPSVAKLTEILPKSLFSAQKLLGQDSDSFDKLVCCPKCSSLYTTEECIVTKSGGSKESAPCKFRKFPQHRHHIHRSPCGTQLMKWVRSPAGTTYLYPRQLYCCQSIISILKERLLSTNFVNACESWRCRKTTPGLYKDIYDGKVWQDFMTINGVPFLSSPYTYALCLNVDWFQPFKHSQYSCGALYVSILNLPRSERYSADNTVLLDVIPGPKEPELTVNTFLEPFVNELLKLWNGVLMRTTSTTVLVRAALLCVACDIPAARKVCGFTGHNSIKACSKCAKVFPTHSFGDKPDYGGFNRDDWPPKTLREHKEAALKHQQVTNRTAQKDIERESGCRYSVLLKLPYFDPIRMCVVDPMHNLLLGSAKHILTVWKELRLITLNHFESIQTKVDSFKTPDDVGRIPTKIAAQFSGFKAEQWRNWTLLFSLYSLKEVLPYRHFNCWQLFVKACHLLCRRSITTTQIQEADTLLIEFCETFETLYGQEHCTINLHLHGHLCECLRDFGPIYAFWLFPFERLNGVLGSFHTNCHDIPLQLMRRYIRLHEFRNQSLQVCGEFTKDFLPLIEKGVYSEGSLKQTCLEFAVKSMENVHPLPPIHQTGLTPQMRTTLVPIIGQLYDGPVDIQVLSIFQKCFSLNVGGFVLGSQNSRHHSSSIVFASPMQPTDRPKLVQIEYFANICYVLRKQGEETMCTVWMAYGNFFLEHPCRVWFGYPTEVWTNLESSESCFILLSQFSNRAAYTLTEVNFGSVIGTNLVFVAVPV